MWCLAVAAPRFCSAPTGKLAVQSSISRFGDDEMDRNRAGLLSRAAYFERTNNPVKAREKLSTAFSAVENHQGILGGLFRGELVDRISWVHKPTRHEWELSLADAYLQRCDYMRAVIFLYEAFVTRAAFERKLNSNDFDQRKEAYKDARGNAPEARRLEILRNAIAHGVRPRNDRDARLLDDEQKLRSEIQLLRKALFGNIGDR